MGQAELWNLKDWIRAPVLPLFRCVAQEAPRPLWAHPDPTSSSQNGGEKAHSAGRGVVNHSDAAWHLLGAGVFISYD